jgi:hypothetical protein
MTLRRALSERLWAITGPVFGIRAALLASEKRSRQMVEAYRLKADARLSALEADLAKAVTHQRKTDGRLKALKTDLAGASASLLAISRKAGQLEAARRADRPQIPDAFRDLIAAIEPHATAAIARTPTVPDPFPHMVISDLFPESIYHQFLAAIPSEEYWEPAGKARLNWRIGQAVAPASSEQLWSCLQHEIAPLILKPLLVAAFREHIAAYWRRAADGDVDELERHLEVTEGRLLLRRPGYKLTAHLDPPDAILTFLLYLARPGDPEDHGTDLYRSAPIPLDRKGIFHPDTHGLAHEYAGTVPFRPNTALVFLTPTSVHGAELPVDAPAYDRVSYQFLLCVDRALKVKLKRARQKTS